MKIKIKPGGYSPGEMEYGIQILLITIFMKYSIILLTEGGKPKSLVIADAIEDKNNNLWFTDLDEGIIFYDRSSNKFSKPFAGKLGERYSTSPTIVSR